MENLLPVRISRIVLIKEDFAFIINDRYKIIMKHENTFLLVWCLLKILKEHTFIQDIKGVSPDVLLKKLNEEGWSATKDQVNTRWYDEVRLERNEFKVYKACDLYDLKEDHKIDVKVEEFQRLFQSIFPSRIKAPQELKLAKNVKLYSTSLEPEQIFLCENVSDAIFLGLNCNGSSDITRYREKSGIRGIISWKHILKVDNKKTSNSEVEVKMINISRIPLTYYILPLDSENKINAEERNVHVFLDDHELPLEIILGSSKKTKKFEFYFSLPKPVETGEIIDFRYSYRTVNSYSPGKNYFEWYFGQPHYFYELNIMFSDRWKISYPKAFCDKHLDVYQPEVVSGQHLKWERYFPEFRETYRIEYIADFQ